MLEYKGSAASVSQAKYGVARVSQVLVRTPYQSDSLAVLRADGSIAFDPYNRYASAPSPLLRGVVFDAMTASGLFKSVLPTASIAAAELEVEVQVLRLALDCRSEGAASRKAVADILVRLVDKTDAVIRTVSASGSSPVVGRNFGETFSTAVSAALMKAFDQMR